MATQLQKTVSKKVALSDFDRLADTLLHDGFIAEGTAPYVAKRLKTDGCVVLFYTSGKIVVQGTQEVVEKVESKLFADKFERQPLLMKIPHVGCDEAGKGELWGPIVVACFGVESQSQAAELAGLGVKDSKLLNDNQINDIANKLTDKGKYAVHSYSMEVLNDEMKRHNNISVVLLKLHGECLDSFFSKFGRDGMQGIVMDKFSVRNNLVNSGLYQDMDIVEETSGERDIAVAAASILARATYLKQLALLEKKYGIEFPKGYDNAVGFGKEFVKMFGEDELGNIAKLTFKTCGRILHSLF